MIGDEAASTIIDEGATPRLLWSRGEGGLLTVPKPRAVRLLSVYLHDEASRKAGCRKS